MEQLNTNVETSTKFVETHPCPYCEKPCRGKQCKECHLKMIEKKQTKCIDCDTIFNGLRPDGSMKKRCFECQKSYKTTHIKNCEDCIKEFHSVLSDGRIYNKCFDCYQKRINKCNNCDKRTFKDLPLCSECYQQEKSKNTYEEKPCKNSYCKNTTTYTFCSKCKTNKDIENEYMISTCEDCSYKYKGNFRICQECKNERNLTK